MNLIQYLVYVVCTAYIVWWLVGAIHRKEKHEITMAAGAWLFITLCFESFGEVFGLDYWTLESPSFLKMIAAVFLVSSGAIFFISSQTMRRKGKPEKGWEQTTELIDTGIFGVVRHPIYFSAFVGLLGVFLMRVSLLSVILAPIGGVLFLLSARYEDQYNEKKFGPMYRAYRERTKFFIPFIY
ncbi:MAG: isoprenylcysteine carboxylmethyltransferase family protein [bacterium]